MQYPPSSAARGHRPDSSRIAVVVAGAGARGAYEAGVLSVVVPFLRSAGHEPDLFIGTSAGAINATLFAAGAHLPADEQADTALAVWRSVQIDDVFRPLLRTGPGTIARWAGQLCRIPGMRLTSLVDTAPLARTAHRLVDWTQLAANLDGGKASLAVVTTSAATNRTVIFVDGNRADPLPPSDTTRPIDYLGVRITAEHVRASAAIPALFPAVEVSTPDTARGWYADGGIRLNAPLKPALSLGCGRLIVVATHPAVYPVSPATGGEQGPPDVDDMMVRVLDAALVDRMVEDLRTLGKINELVADGRRTGASQRRYVDVPYRFFGPEERGTLGALAATSFDDRYRWPGGALRTIRNPDLPLLGRLLGGDGARRGDLLSYLLFDGAFIDAAIGLGQRDAQLLLADGDGTSWLTAAPKHVAPDRISVRAAKQAHGEALRHSS
ncbi:patatin-like phospholipase family protein [Rhodococcus koreensis]|uniref:patatin-like phospholipase family protein n=1 Tax=Rhodococcus koreensis TaxID=99653 RepID=UPI00197EA6CD|nr:patatin-like phospholipase family protein [Rhodococcus koreensis]QSE84931.1 patatin-like phospholipase family protein [Rhodococcus koreensis]